MSNVLVRKLKYDGHVKSEWQGELLSGYAEDWLVVLHHPDRHVKFKGGEAAWFDGLFVHCHHTVKPATILLSYTPDGIFRDAKCDAALPAIQYKHTIEFVDLDLDLIVNADFSTYVRDEDTFAQHQQTMAYPQHVIEQARSGITLAKQLVSTRSFPFDRRFVPRLTQK